MYDKYKDEGLVVLGVHAWSGRESKSEVKEFVAEYKVTYPVLLGGRRPYRELYQGRYVPRVFFIDRQGRIAATKLGFEHGQEKDLERTVKSLL